MDLNPAIDYRKHSSNQILFDLETMIEEYVNTHPIEKRGPIVNRFRNLYSWEDVVSAVVASGNHRLFLSFQAFVAAEQHRLTGSHTEAVEALSKIEAELASIETELKADYGISKTNVLGDNRLPRDPLTQERLPRLVDTVKKFGSGRPLYQVLIEVMEKTYPSLMKDFYPRTYVNTDAYHSPKGIAAFLANVTAETIRMGFDRTPNAYRLMMPSFKYLVDRKMPLFFIAPDLLKAVTATDFDGDINWVDLKLPYEHGIFVLPRGAFSHPEDGEVSMILWSRGGPGTYPPPTEIGIPPLIVEDTFFVITALCADKGLWYDATLNAKHRPTLRLRNLFYREGDQAMPPANKFIVGLDEDLTETDSEFLENVGAILFGTIMAMNARPELYEPAKLERAIPAKSDRPRREFWSPNIIGRRYKIKREVPRIVDGKFVTSSNPSGTHASPRAHWRRGHTRQQPYGPQRRERKTIWIEPILIGVRSE